MKEAVKPLLSATIQKRLYNNNILLSTSNDKSSFVYEKLLLKVGSKEMTVYGKSRLRRGLWTYNFQHSKLNKSHICQRFNQTESN